MLRKLLLSLALLIWLPTAAFALCGTGSGTCFWVSAGSNNNWSTAGATNHWAITSGGANGAGPPASGDAIVFDANSGVGTSNIDTSPTISTFDASASTAVTLTHAAGTVTVTGNTFIFNSTIIYQAVAQSRIWKFTSTSGTTSITSAGQRFGNITFDGVGGTFQLQDNLRADINTSTQITLTNGTLDCNTHTAAVTTGLFVSNVANIRALNMGGDWTITGANAGSVWDMGTGASMTLTKNSANIFLTGTAQGKTFAGGGLSYNTLNIASSLFFTTISGSNTFVNIALTAPLVLRFINGATQTITSAFTWTGGSGTGGQILIESSAIGLTSTIAATAGSTASWAAFTDMTFTGAPVANNSFGFGTTTGITINPPSGGGGGGGFIIGG